MKKLFTIFIVIFIGLIFYFVFLNNKNLGADIETSKFAQIVCIDTGTYRKGINNIGDIVAIHDDDVELTGGGYNGFNIVKVEGMTAKQVQTKINENKVEIKIEKEVEYYLKNSVWYKLIDRPKYTFNTSDLTVNDLTILQSKGNKSNTLLKIKDNLL